MLEACRQAVGRFGGRRLSESWKEEGTPECREKLGLWVMGGLENKKRGERN